MRMSLRLICLLAMLALAPNLAAAQGAEKGLPRAIAEPLPVALDGDGVRLTLPGGALIRRTTAEVRSPRVIAFPSAPTLVATWEEDDGANVRPYYAISRDGVSVAVVRSPSYEIKLRRAAFEPGLRAAEVAPAMAAGPDNRLHIVQFVTQPLDVYREALAELGGMVRHYLPDNAYIVEMTADVADQVAGLPFVRAIEPYHPGYRLEPPLRDALAAAPHLLGAQRYRIEIFEVQGLQKSTLIDAIDALGGTVHERDPRGMIVHATLSAEQLLAVAQRPEVVYIDRWGSPQEAMNNVRSVGGANYLESVAGYTGTGVRGEIMDSGCQTDHPAYASRLMVRRPGTVQSHGTSTFGIVFGDGTGNASGRGMLPDGIGIFSEWAPPNRYVDTASLLEFPYFCVFQSNSWGTSPLATEYTSASSELDQIVFDYDIVILQGQGNYDDQDALREAWGKNIVSVGGIFHYNTASLSNDQWDGPGSNASIGPAEDGRIKPDLSFWYDNILTTTTTSTYTSGFGGTSAATPETAGHFGLFFEMWADGIFGNPVSGGSVFDERPHASTAKAVMINTAQQYTFSGTGHDLTRVHQGWGLANVQNVYDRRNNMLIVDETDVLEQFDVRTYTTLITPAQPFNDALRATLVYTDYHGTTSAVQHRINDLTLKVTSPTGTIYYGNNGLLDGNWSTSGGSPNTIDNVENVFIPNPAAGAWTIEVSADDVNQDGHVETPNWDVDYALVISGGVSGADCNANDIPDPCDLSCAAPGCSVAGCGLSLDCNANSIPDECEGPDCNANQIPDECELVDNDCNADLVPDDCQLAGNDCNGNLLPDDCDADNLFAAIAHPQDQHPCPGDQAVFTAVTPGATAYQWYKNGNELLSDGGNVFGATTDTLTIESAGPANEGTYTCEVSLGCITTSSMPAALDLTSDSLSVMLTTPAVVQGCAGEGTLTAIFEVAVNDPTNVTYQWEHNGTPLVDGGDVSGATTPHLEIANVQAADVGNYYCTVSNGCTAPDPSTFGTIVLSSAVAQQPPAVVCAEYGSSAVFKVVAAAPVPDFYMWFEGAVQLSNGGRISGADTDTLTLSNVQAGDNGRTFRLRLLTASPFCSNFSQNTMLQAVPVGECPACPNPGDMDGDGDYDLFDLHQFTLCFGEDVSVNAACLCANVADANATVDLNDWMVLEQLVGGPN